MSRKDEQGLGLSADDIALIAGILLVIADAVALLAILKAREEKSTTGSELSTIAEISRKKTRGKR
ncbi:hypothetical protein FHS15_000912 [Paenibacillus castaneae]|uniref:hypothetical protein n=1 Tax=Paenibacillus castaneae TaxID=474957 RepID=UPI000C999F39|nr:hypothetical protein [Paenibacillus castaneae]NIK75812.1 hypothetical protein [Paenibacillus castaneae]